MSAKKEYVTTMNTITNDDFSKYAQSWDKDAIIISDPPYNQKYHYSEYSDNLNVTDYKKMLCWAFNGKKSVIISYPEETINLIAPTLDCSLCQQSVSWVYNSNTAKQHRLVTWWNCKPDMSLVGQPYKNPNDKRIAKRILEGKQAKLYDWWYINQVKNVSKKNNPHPCPIPYELAERIIKISSRESDIIIDPFAGSGTILHAAKNLGRRYLGYEIDDKYYSYMKGCGL
jgi:DNA modification methylase